MKCETKNMPARAIGIYLVIDVSLDIADHVRGFIGNWQPMLLRRDEFEPWPWISTKTIHGARPQPSGLALHRSRAHRPLGFADRVSPSVEIPGEVERLLRGIQTRVLRAKHDKTDLTVIADEIPTLHAIRARGGSLERRKLDIPAQADSRRVCLAPIVRQFNQPGGGGFEASLDNLVRHGRHASPIISPLNRP
ncbi:MAG: hypothetical protein BWX86_01569 [Verrucomicrobia bacterium ADurb.Bin122]|nr:MAG: hypothetical protein BWX86_01569 [Verrucomicrobia bacterium ADurb.Bin122]